MRFPRPSSRMVAAAVAVLAFASNVMACPFCKESISTARNDLQEAGGPSVGGAFNKSIYLMIAGFFSSLVLVCFKLGRAIRDADDHHSAGH